jgi:hypothetical protein
MACRYRNRVLQATNRWVSVASAYPVSSDYGNVRGIDKTDWMPIDKALYDQAIDVANYRRGN